MPTPFGALADVLRAVHTSTSCVLLSAPLDGDSGGISACTGESGGAQLGSSRSAFWVAHWQCHLWAGPWSCATAGRVTQALQGPAKCPLGLSSESEECEPLTNRNFTLCGYFCGVLDRRNTAPTKFSGIHVSLSSGQLRIIQPQSTNLYLHFHYSSSGC